MPCWRMVSYEVTTGPKGYQVVAINPEWQDVVVGNFCSFQAAEAFAERMREIDAGVHSIANKT